MEQSKRLIIPQPRLLKTRLALRTNTIEAVSCDRRYFRPTGEDNMKEEHNKAAEHHESAAKSHRAAAEAHDRNDHAKAKEHATQAQQHAQNATEHSKTANAKSNQQR